MPTEANNSGETNTSTTTQATTPVEFTPEQQTAIDKIIQDRLKRANDKHKAEVDSIAAEKAAIAAEKAALEQKLHPTTTTQTTTNGDTIVESEWKRLNDKANAEAEAARRAAQAKESEARAAREQLANFQKQAAISRAAEKLGFINPDIIVQLTGSNVVVGDDGKLSVVGINGEPRFNSAYQPMSVDEYLAEYGDQNKYLVRGETKTGAGSTTSASFPGGGTYKLTELFGKESNSKLANQLALQEPARYKALRAEAVKAGLLAK